MNLMGFGGPSAYTPPPHEVNGSLVNALHNALLQHNDPEEKAHVGQMLAKALARQAKNHAALPMQRPAVGPGGAVTEPGSFTDDEGASLAAAAMAARYPSPAARTPVTGNIAGLLSGGGPVY